MSEDPTVAAGQPAADPTPPAESKRGRLPSGFTTLRDIFLFVIGVTVIAHEVFYSETAEAAAVAVGLTLTGLPLVFGADERKSR